MSAVTNFLEDLWSSIFTPGTTPTLLAATNATFAALQVLLITLLFATYSIHFFILSIVCGGLWWAINWFATELKKVQEEEAARQEKKDQDFNKSLEPSDSDTETETTETKILVKPDIRKEKVPENAPKSETAEGNLRRRKGSEIIMGAASGYVSTDSEWEKVDDGEDGHK